MAEEGRQFTTCPHCRHDTDIPTGFIVAWVAQACSSCSVPHIAPKAFSRVEVCDVLTNESVFDIRKQRQRIEHLENQLYDVIKANTTAKEN